MTSDDERIAYLADGGAGALDAADLAELDELRALLADPAVWAEPNAGLEDDIVALIEREARGSLSDAAEPATAPAPAPEPLSAVAADRPPALGVVDADGTVRPARSRQRRRWGVGLVAAAAVVAALLAGTIVLRSDDTSAQFQATLVGAEPGSTLSGEVELFRTDSGWRIELDAPNLERLDNGQFYQAWLRNEAGTLIPIGSFNEGTDVVLWAGASPVEFSTFTVTREQADNDQASSGQRVLAGPITAT